MANESGISRRSFFAGAGLAAGAYAALAPINAMAAVATGQARGYSSLSLAVEIDGAFAGFATDAEGGGQEAKLVTDVAGETRFTNLRFGGLKIVPVTLRFTSLPGAKFPEWFAARDGVPRTVALSLVEITTGTEFYRLTLNRARLAGIRSLPSDLGKSEKASFETEVVLVPEGIVHEVGGQKKRSFPISQKSKAQAISSFRLFFQGLEKYSPGIIKIDSVGVLAEVVEQRRTSVESVPVNLGVWKPEPIKFSVTLESAAGFYQWFADMARGGAAEKSGQLQWLGVDGKMAASIDILGALISKVSAPFSGNESASDAGLVAVEVEVACVDTKFNYGGLIA